MKKYSMAAIIGCAILSVVPASASNSSFVFTNGVSSNPYATANGVTVNMYAFDIAGTSAGPGTGKFTTASIGVYGANGIGVCETGSGLPGNDCNSPNHQINQGNDFNAGSHGQTGGPATDYYEFILFQFTGGTVNLSSMTLGNFGTNGTTTDPFGATYWTYTANTSLASMETALASATVSTLGSDGFSAANSTTCPGCAVNATGVNDALSGSNVTYLLFGASITDAAGTDFFKIQDLNVSATNTTVVSSTPEPATFGLIGLALAGLGVYGRKRKSR
ncbi:MAG TPA: PEP-CTERM sorting domain-containing protein [Bryobacteraceae bacterium]